MGHTRNQLIRTLQLTLSRSMYNVVVKDCLHVGSLATKLNGIVCVIGEQ